MPKQNAGLIAYCGMYCGNCPCYRKKENIPDLARDLKEALRKSKFELAAQEISLEEFKHYREFYDCLGAVTRLKCRKSCKSGGGSRNCKVRQCCMRNGLAGCWECDDFEECKTLEALTTVHRETLLGNLNKIKKSGLDGSIGRKRPPQ